MMPSRESDRNAIPIEVAAATATAAATSTFVPPLRYPARTLATTAAEGRYSPRWPHMASLGPRVSPFEFEGMVQDTPPPLSLSVLLDDEFRAPTPAVAVPDRAAIDRRRARMLRHKQKIALHEAEDAAAAAVVPHTIAEASRPDARLSLPGLRNGGDLPHLDHQMMLDLEEHQSLAVPTTRRSNSDFEEEDLRKSIADIFAEDRSREHISSSSDRDRDRDRDRRRKYRHSRHSSHSSRNRGEEESREFREYRDNRDSKRRSHESQGSNYRRSIPDSGGSRPGSGSSKLDTPPRTPRRRHSGVVGEVPVSSSRRYRTPEEQEAHEQRKAQRRAAREAERLEKQEVHVNESGYEWYQGHERYGLPERHYERRERREHYDFREDRDYRGVDRADRRDRHERPEQTQRPEPYEHPEPVSSREVPEEVHGRHEKYDRRDRQERRERRRERRESYGKTLAPELEPAVLQPAEESLEVPPAPAPVAAPALAPALVSADVPAAPERKGKEVGFDLPPEEIKRHRSRSFRQRSSNTGYSRDDFPRQPSPEKRFFGMRNTEGVVRKSSSPPPQDRYTYVPTRDASLPEDMRPRTRDRDIPRTRDRRMSEGTYDRPRRSRIEDPPRQSGPLEEGDDAARRARHERRRMKEAKEQEKKSGGLRAVFKRLFN
ncbi:hypothetical protein TgHK011_007283 [Trichoderma gracile]|nr:hypothetical protein TgHK011_007283 [Trichoderma gracile]